MGVGCGCESLGFGVGCKWRSGGGVKYLELIF